MALVTVNDLPVTEGTITYPRIGVWVADLIVTSEEDIAGAVSIEMDGLTLSGTVYRGGPFISDARLRVVGGKAGLFTTATPKHYKDSVLVRNIVNDLLGNAGESLSSLSDAGIITSKIDAWTTTAQPVSRAILALLETIDDDAILRVLEDGTVFIGVDDFPTVDDGFEDASVLDEDPINGMLTVALDVPNLLPGVTCQGRKLSYVKHQISDRGVRAHAWYEQ